MKVILKETIDSLGIIGSEVKVAAGYARNYLVQAPWMAIYPGLALPNDGTGKG